ncbi:MAG TPA: hypothetical protein VGQ65_14785 [Thermoanaerobaculia bacterium]|jgi:hypothetical protein|nr:hypothetical protein [Thermoanaerobaculia bacterium]
MLAALALLVAIETLSDCQEMAIRSAIVPASGIQRVIVIGRAGFLHIEGRPGATTIRAEGRACAGREHLLVGMDFKTTRKGSELTIEAMVPNEPETLVAAAPRLDVTMIVPTEVALDIADTTGAIEVHNVRRNVDIVAHGTGPIVVSDVGGDLTVHSSRRGGVDYKRVAGRVSIH